MDAGRFDALSKSLANRHSRRSALRSFGAGGLAAGVLAALGVEHADAAAKTCSLKILATTATGKHNKKKYSGTLTLRIGDQGAIDDGSFDLDDGTSLALVGQATGRALNLRITLADKTILALEGTAANDLILCRGAASGAFSGPDDTDLGTWRTVEGTGASSGGGGSTGGNGGSNGGSSNGGGGSTGGASNGGGSTSGGGGGGNTSGGGGGSSCASGVVCGGVCCVAAPGLSADKIACNAGACECTYSCASAGCPNSGASGSIVNTCGSDPQPHCHSECNAPSDNGCGNTTCGNGETLDLDSCTCVANATASGNCGGADLLHDAANCGFCGVVCGSGFCQNGVCAATDPCPQEGRTNCNSLCMDTQNDANNCGGCGIVCPSGQCIQGGCTDVVK